MTVVTRFAPSPTGYLHIGGARTALFCWLFARHSKGKFLLRIEDTDHDRNNPAAIDAIFDGLSWLGLNADEPPVMQSTRAARHAEIAHELVKRGKAYLAYETAEELELRRNQREIVAAWTRELAEARTSIANRADQPVDQVLVGQLSTSAASYSHAAKVSHWFQIPPSSLETNMDLGKWSLAASYVAHEALLDLSRAFRSEYRDGSAQPSDPNAPYVVRLRMPDKGRLTVLDQVQGEVSQKYEDLDDLVLLRSDGTPTYMLAVVVDDHDMGVTHVIRGDDHLTNTFRQLPIIKGMGWPEPTYAHVPMIHGPDGKKLSKRHGAQGAQEFRAMGYLPEALRNYLLRLGWSHGDAEIISTEQAVDWFTLEGLNKAPSRLDLQKLDSVNQHYMAQADDQRLADLFFARPETQGFSGSAKARIRAAMPHLKTRSANLAAMADQARFLTDLRPIKLEGKQAAQLTPEAKGRLSAIAARLEALPGFSEPEIKEDIAQYCAAESISLGKVGPALRAALTGGAPSPDITLVIALLGRDEALARLKDQTG